MRRRALLLVGAELFAQFASLGHWFELAMHVPGYRALVDSDAPAPNALRGWIVRREQDSVLQPLGEVCLRRRALSDADAAQCGEANRRGWADDGGALFVRYPPRPAPPPRPPPEAPARVLLLRSRRWRAPREARHAPRPHRPSPSDAPVCRRSERSARSARSAAAAGPPRRSQSRQTALRLLWGARRRPVAAGRRRRRRRQPPRRARAAREGTRPSWARSRRVRGHSSPVSGSAG